MYIYFLSRTTQDNHVHEIDRKCHPSQRIKLAGDNGLNLRDAMLEVELIKVTVADLWTVIEPKQITNAECNKLRKEVTSFTPGWLTDTVRMFFFLVYVFSPNPSLLAIETGSIHLKHMNVSLFVGNRWLSTVPSTQKQNHFSGYDLRITVRYA